MPFNHNVIELEVDKDKGSQIYYDWCEFNVGCEHNAIYTWYIIES